MRFLRYAQTLTISTSRLITKLLAITDGLRYATIKTRGSRYGLDCGWCRPGRTNVYDNPFRLLILPTLRVGLLEHLVD